MPPWMHTDGKSPAEMFGNLDANGQNVVVLCYHLLQEQGGQLDDSISAQLKALEEKLLVKVQSTPDNVKMKVDNITAEGWLKILRQVFLLFGSVCTFMLYMEIGERCLEALGQMSEFGERCLEALGQMRKHSSEIVEHLFKALWDAKMKPWPLKKFQFHILDHWWIDPIKQAERDRKAAEKEKEDGGSK